MKKLKDLDEIKLNYISRAQYIFGFSVGILLVLITIIDKLKNISQLIMNSLSLIIGFWIINTIVIILIVMIIYRGYKSYNLQKYRNDPDFNSLYTTYYNSKSNDLKRQLLANGYVVIENRKIKNEETAKHLKMGILYIFILLLVLLLLLKGLEVIYVFY